MTAGVSAVAPALRGGAIFDQRWCDLLFLHWPVDPTDVAAWMPPGTRPDVVEGLTYVGLVPFQMRAARVGRRLPVPYFGSFGEVNVRLYSVDDEGRHGVVFRSLDASRLAVCLAARAMGVPYVWSRVRADPYASTRADPFPPVPIGAGRTWSVRRRRGGPTAVITARVGMPVAPTPLEVFLTARWGMHGAWAGRGLWVPNNHGPWPLHAAEVVRLDDDLVTAAGVRPVGPMLRPLWSPGVRARFGRPGQVSAAASCDSGAASASTSAARTRRAAAPTRS